MLGTESNEADDGTGMAARRGCVERSPAPLCRRIHARTKLHQLPDCARLQNVVAAYENRIRARCGKVEDCPAALRYANVNRSLLLLSRSLCRSLLMLDESSRLQTPSL
jgi:hypothetical protein